MLDPLKFLSFHRHICTLNGAKVSSWEPACVYAFLFVTKYRCRGQWSRWHNAAKTLECMPVSRIPPDLIPAILPRSRKKRMNTWPLYRQSISSRCGFYLSVLFDLGFSTSGNITVKNAGHESLIWNAIFQSNSLYFLKAFGRDSDVLLCSRHYSLLQKGV